MHAQSVEKSIASLALRVLLTSSLQWRIPSRILLCVMNAKTVVQPRRRSTPSAGQTALLQRGSTAAVPLLLEHSQISDLGTRDYFLPYNRPS